MKQLTKKESTLVYRVLSSRRIVKVLKHEKRFQFRVLVVVGDQLNKVGLGIGKSKKLKMAIKKAILIAKKNIFSIKLTPTKTILDTKIFYYKASKLILKPAKQDHGIISGYPMNIILKISGIKNIITKSFGSRNSMNISKATILVLKDFEI
jgi:small subunit ribosomal protein S5